VPQSGQFFETLISEQLSESVPASEYPVRFRFAISWSYLSEPSRNAKPAKSAHRAPVAVAMETALVPRRTAQDPETQIAPQPKQGSKAQWEMVIPKMDRPPARIAAPALPAAVLPPVAIPTPPQPVEPAPEAQPSAESGLSFLRAPEPSRILLDLMRDKRKAAGLGAIAVLCLGMIVWMLAPASSAPPTPDGVWSRNAALAKDRELVLYKPSAPASNYWIEFTWVPDSKGIQWIYRVHDTANYYAVRLRQAQPAASGALIAEHFSVSSGVEGTPVRKIVAVAAAGGPVTVRLEASGSSFTLALQNIVRGFLER